MSDYYLFDVMNKKFHGVGDSLSIGRSKGDLIIQDPGLSGQHCLIYKEDDTYYIEDLESSNGTYINRERIDGEAELDNFDQIVIGQQKIIFTNTQDLEEIRDGLEDFGDEDSTTIFDKIKSFLKIKK
jgi:pSer/pThr/pTyr-binding forkhead associated (FHA) protein